MEINAGWLSSRRGWLLALLVAVVVGFFLGRWRRPTYHYHTSRYAGRELLFRTEEPSGRTWTFDAGMGRWESASFQVASER